MALTCRAFNMSPKDYKALTMIEFRALLETLDLEEVQEQ
jgi:hypothetical protein